MLIWKTTVQFTTSPAITPNRLLPAVFLFFGVLVDSLSAILFKQLFFSFFRFFWISKHPKHFLKYWKHTHKISFTHFHKDSHVSYIFGHSILCGISVLSQTTSDFQYILKSFACRCQFTIKPYCFTWRVEEAMSCVNVCSYCVAFLYLMDCLADLNI